MNNGVMYKISKLIVDQRRLIIFLFMLACVISGILYTHVRVNSDIASYLPDQTETKIAQNIMDEELGVSPMVNLMVNNITYEQAENVILPIIEGTEGVKSVTIDSDKQHYNNSAALFDVSLEDDDDVNCLLAVIDNIKSNLSDYDCYSNSPNINDSVQQIEKELPPLLAAAFAVVVIVLLISLQSYMEVLIFLLSFLAAAAINMGSNIIFGEISSVTKAIAIVLQLALSIDYSIILFDRFAEEKRTKDNYHAIVAALSKAIIEISSSSLTTMAGLAALVVMQLKIGKDLGLVLCKGILCSLLSVFLLMPGLLIMFSDKIDKTQHRSFIPDIKPFADFAVKFRYIFVAVFVVCAAAGCIFSSKCPYSFNANAVNTENPSTDKEISVSRIESNFGPTELGMIIVPSGDADKEKILLNRVSEMENVTKVTGLSTTEVKDGYTLTQEITPKELSELVGIDYSACKLLYQLYGVKHEQYQSIFSDTSDYRISIMNLFEFVHEQSELGVINLGESSKEKLDEMYETLTDAKTQMQGENYSLMLFTFSGEPDSDETYDLINRIRGEGEKLYDKIYVAGNATSCYDLEESFSSDNMRITLITIAAVLIVLLFTFRSASLPVLLVLIIQGSTWINFSFPYFTGNSLFFLGYLIVSSIQMGATIDYAIVFTSRYTDLRKSMSATAAAAKALSEAFPTILTSGSILTIIGYLLGMLSSNIIIYSLGFALGRGTLISIIIVLTALPGIMILCDKLISKTYFKIPEIGEIKMLEKGE